jgi:hypothetical protein
VISHNLKAIVILLCVAVSGVATVMGLEYVSRHESDTFP